MSVRALILVAGVVLSLPQPVRSQSPVPAPVSHPVLTHPPTRTPAAWRSGVGGYGESLARADLTARGYQVHVLKLPSNQGIDLVALRRSPAGRVTDVKLVEVKTHHGNGPARVSTTSHGQQLSRQWLADRLLRLQAAGPAGREVAREVHDFRTATRTPVERLGELHDINLRTGRYLVRDPVTRAARESRPLRDVLVVLATQTRDHETARWARQHLVGSAAVSAAGMSSWSAATGSEGRATSALRRGGRDALMTAARGSRTLARAAGPIGLLASAAIDGYEFHTLTTAYHRGEVSGREYTVRVTRLVGGLAGAGLGAAGGAYVGASLGAFGGPFAWVTVPAGTALGAGIGGLVGYFGGRYVSGQVVTNWYESLDRRITEGITEWFVRGPCPTGLARP